MICVIKCLKIKPLKNTAPFQVYIKKALVFDELLYKQ